MDGRANEVGDVRIVREERFATAGPMKNPTTLPRSWKNGLGQRRPGWRVCLTSVRSSATRRNGR